jgi:hypothetical protein
LSIFKFLHSSFVLDGIRSARDYHICTSSELVEIHRMTFSCLQ